MVVYVFCIIPDGLKYALAFVVREARSPIMFGINVQCFQFEPVWSHPLFAAAPNSSFYIMASSSFLVALSSLFRRIVVWL